MKTTRKKLSDTRVEMQVTLDAADLKVARDQALTRLAQDLKVQGFRKGKAPASLVEKQVSPNEIANETIDIAVRTNVAKAFEAEKQPPIAITNVNVTKYVPDETAEFTATADVLPDIKLGDYKNLKAKMGKVEPTAADIQEIIDNIVKAYSEKTVAKKKAELGDEVIIDFVGKRENGEEFAGGSAKDHHLELGSGQFIPGFEDAIVGHESGDKFDIKVTFPKDYPEKSLAGQPAIFETLVKQVNEVKVPKLDNELAKKCGNFETVADLKADIKKNLQAQNQQRAYEQYRDDLVQDLVKKSKVAAPEILINDQMRFIRDDLTRNVASHGMTLEQYLAQSGMTIEEWEKQAKDVAEQRVKSSLVLQILAREQNIQVSDAEVEAKIAELRDVYQNSKEALDNLKKPEVRQDIKNRMIIDKTLDFLTVENLQSADKSKKDTKTTQTAKKPSPKKDSKKTTKTTKKSDTK